MQRVDHSGSTDVPSSDSPSLLASGPDATRDTVAVLPRRPTSGNGRGLLIGVAGGTGSGKTTLARSLAARLGDGASVVLEQDHYYRSNERLTLAERRRINYDHPDAFDLDLLAEHLSALLAGRAIERPIYCCTTSARRPETVRLEPRPVVILEGILVLESERLRSLMDIRLFVDADPDVRFIRRLRRDLVERGRTLESVLEQYLRDVRPMHLQFVEPSKRWADVIVPEGGQNEVALSLLAAQVASLLAERR